MLKVSFIGYIGDDCRMKNVEGQVAITFSVGVTKAYKNRQGNEVSKTNWIGCTIWRKPEHTRIAEFLKRGRQVWVEGEPSVRAWVKAADQSANASFDCRVTELELMGSPVNNAPAQAAPAPQITAETNAVIDKKDPADNDDLPF